jgi:hypothetical protein
MKGSDGVSRVTNSYPGQHKARESDQRLSPKKKVRPEETQFRGREN